MEKRLVIFMVFLLFCSVSVYGRNVLDGGGVSRYDFERFNIFFLDSWLNNISVGNLNVSGNFCLEGGCISNWSFANDSVNFTGIIGPQGPAGENAYNVTYNVTYNITNNYTTTVTNNTYFYTTVIANEIFNYTNIKGSNLTLSSGDINREFNYSGVKFIGVDNFMLHPEIDYSYALDVITFLSNIWDEQDITLYYSVNNTNTLNYTNYYGSSLSGSDGGVSRELSFVEPRLVIVDSFALHPEIDYSYSGGIITFNNNVWNTQVITIWYH